LSKMMPTLGRKPSRSSIINSKFLNLSHYARRVAKRNPLLHFSLFLP
jgi:hypothetical protein